MDFSVVKDEYETGYSVWLQTQPGDPLYLPSFVEGHGSTRAAALADGIKEVEIGLAKMRKALNEELIEAAQPLDLR